MIFNHQQAGNLPVRGDLCRDCVHECTVTPAGLYAAGSMLSEVFAGMLCFPSKFHAGGYIAPGRCA